MKDGVFSSRAQGGVARRRQVAFDELDSPVEVLDKTKPLLAEPAGNGDGRARFLQDFGDVRTDESGSSGHQNSLAPPELEGHGLVTPP